MKAALHRSLIFWSGILVMSFITWAWRDSLDRSSGCGAKQWELVSANSGISFGPVGGARTWKFYSHPMTSFNRVEHNIVPAPHLVRSTPAGPEAPKHFASPRDLNVYWASMYPHGWIIFIPYWLLLLAVTPVWIAALWWRARRRRTARGLECTS